MITKATAPLLLLCAACCGSALADDSKPDGLWRGNGGAAVSYASGNTRSASLTLNGDAARQTKEDKLSLYAQILNSRAETTANGVSTMSTTANQWQAGTRYDRNLTDTKFGFGGLDFAHDQIQLLSLRSAVSGGLGHHAIKTPDTQWDLFAGLTYRTDRYIEPGVTINNRTRSRFEAIELLLSEESTNRFTDTTSFKQRFIVTPNLGSDRGFLAAFDIGLLVAINRTLSLKVSLQDRYNSLSQAPIRKNDVVLFTGVNLRFGGSEAEQNAKVKALVSEFDFPPPCNLADSANPRDPRWSNATWRCSSVQR